MNFPKSVLLQEIALESAGPKDNKHPFYINTEGADLMGKL